MPEISQREFERLALRAHPFRKLIVYPSLLRGVRANWDETMTGTKR